MKRVVFFILMVFLAIGFTFAQGGAEEEPDEIDVYYGMVGPDGAYFRDIVNAFEEEYGVEVEANAYEWATLWTRLEASYAAGNPPEAFVLHPSEIPVFAEKEMLVDLEGLVDKNEYTAGSIEGNYYDDTLYALPIDLHTATMYYNVDMFKEAGLDPDNPPETYEELVEYAKKLTIPEKEQWGFGLETRIDGGYFAFSGSYWSNGGEFLSDDFTEAAINNDAMRKTLNQYRDLAWKYDVSPRRLEDAVREFRAKNIAIVFAGTWHNAPEGGLPSVEGLNYKTAKIPLFGDKEVYWKAGHSLAVPKNPSNQLQDLGKEFVEFASENSILWNKSGMIPVRKDAFNDPSIADLIERNKGSIDQMEHAKFFPMLPQGYSEIFDGSVDRPIMGMLQTYFSEKDPDIDAVIQGAEKKVNNVLSRYYK